jgi:hypothetical protein
MECDDANGNRRSENLEPSPAPRVKHVLVLGGVPGLTAESAPSSYAGRWSADQQYVAVLGGCATTMRHDPSCTSL